MPRLQFDDPDGDAVHVEHQIRPARVTAAQRHFLHDHKIIRRCVFPVDQLDLLKRLPRLGLNIDAVAQQAIDRLVVVVEAAVRVVRLDLEQVDGSPDLLQRVARRQQVGAQQLLLDVAVVRTVGAVPEVAVAEFVAEQGDDTVLGLAFGFADVAHLMISQWPALVGPT